LRGIKRWTEAGSYLRPTDLESLSFGLQSNQKSKRLMNLRFSEKFSGESETPTQNSLGINPEVTFLDPGRTADAPSLTDPPGHL
jgi:hypothetical protein